MLSTRKKRLWHTDPLASIAGVMLLVAGIAPSFTPTAPLVLAAFAITALLILSCLLPIDRSIVLPLVAGGLMLGWCWYTMLERTPPPLSSDVSIVGTLAQLPDTSGGNQRLTVLVSESSVPFLIHRPVTVLSQEAIEVTPGQTIHCECRVPTNSNPLPRQIWLGQLSRNQAVLLFAQPSITVGDMSPSSRWWLVRLRSAIVSRSAELWRRPESSLAAGLIVGSRESFSSALTSAMQRTGTTHLVAVSGQNVAIVLWIVGLLLPRRRPWVRLTILAGVLGMFVVVTGGTASVMRAGIAAIILLVGSAVGRPTSAVRLLVLVAAALALANPLIVRADLGFQLSFLAVFGLIVFTRPITNLLPLPRWLGVPVATTLAASLATAPLIGASFGTVSIISPLTNLVLVAIVNPAMILAGITVAGSFITPVLGSVLAWLTTPFLAVIIAIINLANHIPGASVTVTFPLWLGWLITGAVALVGLVYQPKGDAND